MLPPSAGRGREPSPSALSGAFACGQLRAEHQGPGGRQEAAGPRATPGRRRRSHGRAGVGRRTVLLAVWDPSGQPCHGPAQGLPCLLRAGPGWPPQTSRDPGGAVPAARWPPSSQHLPLCLLPLAPASTSVIAPRIFRAAKPLWPSLLAYFLSSPVLIFPLLSPSPLTSSQEIPAPPGCPAHWQAVRPLRPLHGRRPGHSVAPPGLCSHHKLRFPGTSGADSTIPRPQHSCAWSSVSLGERVQFWRGLGRGWDAGLGRRPRAAPLDGPTCPGNPGWLWGQPGPAPRGQPAPHQLRQGWVDGL